MNKSEYVDIELKDVEVFSYHFAFYDLFKKNEITKLHQVLNDEEMYLIMEKCKSKTRRELSAFINLMKYKYLNVPITNDYLLERKIATTEYTIDETLINLGFPSLCIKDLKSQIKMQGSEVLSFKVIDFFKRIINQGLCLDQTRKIIEIYLDSYNKNNQVINLDNNSEALVILKKQLEKLVVMRDNLDLEITNLKEQIEKIDNKKGGYNG